MIFVVAALVASFTSSPQARDAIPAASRMVASQKSSLSFLDPSNTRWAETYQLQPERTAAYREGAWSSSKFWAGKASPQRSNQAVAPMISPIWCLLRY